MAGSLLDTHNRVFFLDRSKAILGAGNDPTALTPHQLGVFNAHTGLSLGSSGTKAREIYFALGIGAGSTSDDIIQSAVMDVSKIESLFDCFKPYSTNLIMLKNIKTKCETSYSFQLVVSTNTSKAIQGFLPIRKSYPIVTPCCDDPCDCASGNSCTEAAVLFAKSVVNDPDKLANAYLVGSAEEDFLDIEVWIDPLDDTAISDAITAGGEGFCFNVIIEPKLEKVYTFCEIPYFSGNSYNNAGLNFYHVQLATTVGFECMGEIEEIRSAKFSGMTKADAMLQDYMQQPYLGGTEFGIYRQLQDGTPLTSTNVSQDLFSGQYSVIALHGTHEVTVGANQRERSSSLQLLLPCGAGSPGVSAALYAVLNYQGVPALNSASFTAIDACACT